MQLLSFEECFLDSNVWDIIVTLDANRAYVRSVAYLFFCTTNISANESKNPKTSTV